MHVRKWVGFFGLFLILVCTVLTGFGIYVYFTNKPPVAEVRQAREALSTAKSKYAGKYANERLEEAEDYYDQSMKEWNVQNEKFFMFRDYTVVKEWALKSVQAAGEAEDEAGTLKNKLRQTVEKELTKTKEQIDRFEKYYKDLPVNRSVLDLYNQGSMRFLEAKYEYRNAEFKQALKLVYKASENLSQAQKAAHFKLLDFYKDYAAWEKNLKLAYNLSKKGQAVVLIDKMQATVSILRSGKEYRIYAAEFGTNWMGDKMMYGDRATPEGVYKITEKKSGAKTKYYKALLLNYPNKEDQKRYDQLVRSGQISPGTGIGGLIEIHGGGGNGVHWTDGCIALDNKDMDVVYRICTVNTPVIIIGSRQTLEEYFAHK